MSRRIRVFIADDHEIVRKGICALLSTKRDIEVIGEAENGKEAIVDVAHLDPDVILMDLEMPKMNGIDAIRHITEDQPDARILVLTSFAGDDKAFPAIKAGAMGYVLKDSGPQEVVHAIRQVHRGEPSIEPTIARKLLKEISQPSRQPPSPHPLTEREVEVLQQVARGLSNAEIARELVISDATVRNHVSSILDKLHLANRIQAALYALREGLASLEDADVS